MGPDTLMINPTIPLTSMTVLARPVAPIIHIDQGTGGHLSTGHYNGGVATIMGVGRSSGRHLSPGLTQLAEQGGGGCINVTSFTSHYLLYR